MREMLSGQIPFWNEFQFCGTSLLADGNTNILNPMSVFYVFFDLAWAYTHGVLLLLCVSIAGSWLYFRERGFSKTASLVGTLGYTLSGQVAFWSLYHGMNLCLALFPLTLFAFRRLEKVNAQRDQYDKEHVVKIRWRLLAFFLVFFSSLGGFIQFAFISAGSVFVEGIEQWSVGGVKRALKSRGLTVLLAVASASVIIIPTIEASIFSHRKLVPYFKGLVADRFSLWSMMFWGSSFDGCAYPNYFYYIGVVIIALSVFAVRKHFREAVSDPFIVYSCIFPAVLMTVYLGVLPKTFQFGVDSDPWRGMFVFALTLSILGASGTDKYVKKVINEKRLVLPPFELILTGLISLGIYSATPHHPDKTNIGFLGILIFSGVVLAIVLKKEKPRVKAVVSCIWLVLLVVANSFVPAGLYLAHNVIRKPVLNPWQTEVLPVTMFSDEGRFITIGYCTGDLEDWGIFNGMRAIGGYGSFFPRSVFTRMGDEGLLPSSFHAATHYLNNSNTDPSILARYGVLYLIERRSANIPNRVGWEVAKAFPDSVIYMNPRYVGRAYLVNEEGNILKGARLVDNTNSYARIVVEANAGDTLVLADSWFPGWICFDNGERVEGFNADGFRGYRIQASGRHEIEWIYRSSSFLVGLVISLVSFIAFLVLVTWEVRSNKKRGIGR
ncbi:MAG: hypothetical protein JRJ47_02080 [Deltaproteobacteria bacterium]|nr:hypothetical protein [Deltaproteobacteria bacterium]